MSRRVWNKGREYKRLVCSPRWTKTRNAYISKHPLCERCEREGRTVLAEVVHHKTPIEDYLNNPRMMQALAYDIDNLEALCNKCHVQTHVELSSRGRESNRKRKQALTNLFVDRWLGGGSDQDPEF